MPRGVPSRSASRSTTSSGKATHTLEEDYPWAEYIPDHPPRKDSATYLKSLDLLLKLVGSLKTFFYGAKPFEDHHGGGLWLKDQDGWFLVRNIAGIEWSAQFCADPKKVDILRQNARRLYAAFPEVVKELGIRKLLDTEITDAKGVARWTDSICNASVPLPGPSHRGLLPKAGGIHHYPTPVAEIAFFKYDDFNLWVTDDQGNEVAVVPASRRGSGDGRVRVMHALPASLVKARRRKLRRSQLVRSDDRVAEQAFGEQYSKLAEGTVDPEDPLSRAKLPSG
jgi:hypothetical protein